MSDVKTIAGLVAGVLSFVAYIPYAWAIIKTRNDEKPVKPNRATWAIWAVVSLMLLASYRSAGASYTIGVPIAYAVCSIIIFFISLKYGDGGWTWFDRWCLAIAAGSAIVWWITGSPLTALVANLGVDLADALPTIKKAYLNPASESRTAWAMFFLGNSANLFAVEYFTFAIAAYPIYMFLGCGAIATLVLFKPRMKKV